MRNLQYGLWALVAAAVLHVGEEYLLDWRSWAQEVSGLLLTWNRFWLFNAGFLLFAAVAAMWGVRRPVLGMALPCLVLINGIFFHIGPTVVLGRISPGVFTSVLLYLPLASWTWWQAGKAGLLTGGRVAAAVLLGGSMMAVPFVIFALS